MNKSINEEKVKEEAKQILDKFAKTLEKVEKEHEIENYVERDEFWREEESGNNPDTDFKLRMLENAPRHDEDFIIAEKGSWK